jgi:archease family protein
MEGCPSFEFLDHTADVLIEARGRTLEEALEEAGLAVYEVMTDTSRVRPLTRREVEVEGLDLYNTVYRWIESLLVMTDSEGLVFSVFRVCEVSQDGTRLKGVVWGEPFDPNRHEHRTIVKAMTYSQMDLGQDEKGCWRLRFVVDI